MNKDILDRMTELPAGTALNAALQENVFTLLVCILNKLPIFLVGKPGCSKSLSMQLIRKKTQSHINVTTDFDSNDLWCTEVAKDAHAILQTGTFIGALESNIQNMMKVPLAIYMFVLHEHNLLSCLFVEDEYMSARGEVLAQMVISNQYVNIDTIPEPSGPECYYCSSEYLNFPCHLAKLF
ncbi:RNF213 [Mytilus edulis]|uniref:RNF213 n=1 Tax=Mytilus edulis TaxID=6550 RepID=A0A8S3RI60_MYTED|nr:RNF213 [Mytilus edulis]